MFVYSIPPIVYHQSTHVLTHTISLAYTNTYTSWLAGWQSCRQSSRQTDIHSILTYAYMKQKTDVSWEFISFDSKQCAHFSIILLSIVLWVYVFAVIVLVDCLSLSPYTYTCVFEYATIQCFVWSRTHSWHCSRVSKKAKKKKEKREENKFIHKI